ncbi:px domain-containing protein [Cyclospora cayetanensis]|uniref:Px domain-containing protein n=1 Tax=Cyclospora cayetanensis TaxID=88456 RepID=A0A1D3D525_9EIME|nr:px domain-containing protein [Cyclospora cayetanensis]
MKLFSEVWEDWVHPQTHTQRTLDCDSGRLTAPRDCILSPVSGSLTREQIPAWQMSSHASCSRDRGTNEEFANTRIPECYLPRKLHRVDGGWRTVRLQWRILAVIQACGDAHRLSTLKEFPPEGGATQEEALPAHFSGRLPSVPPFSSLLSLYLAVSHRQRSLPAGVFLHSGVTSVFALPSVLTSAMAPQPLEPDKASPGGNPSESSPRMPPRGGTDAPFPGRGSLAAGVETSPFSVSIPRADVVCEGLFLSHAQYRIQWSDLGRLHTIERRFREFVKLHSELQKALSEAQHCATTAPKTPRTEAAGTAFLAGTADSGVLQPGAPARMRSSDRRADAASAAGAEETNGQAAQPQGAGSRNALSWLFSVLVGKCGGEEPAEGSYAALPPKSVLSFQGPAFIEQRRRQLERYLRLLLQQEQVLQAKPLWDFLGSKGREAQAVALFFCCSTRHMLSKGDAEQQQRRLDRALQALQAMLSESLAPREKGGNSGVVPWRLAHPDLALCVLSEGEAFSRILALLEEALSALSRLCQPFVSALSLQSKNLSVAAKATHASLSRGDSAVPARLPIREAVHPATAKCSREESGSEAPLRSIGSPKAPEAEEAERESSRDAFPLADASLLLCLMDCSSSFLCRFASARPEELLAFIRRSDGLFRLHSLLQRSAGKCSTPASWEASLAPQQQPNRDSAAAIRLGSSPSSREFSGEALDCSKGSFAAYLGTAAQTFPSQRLVGETSTDDAVGAGERSPEADSVCLEQHWLTHPLERCHGQQQSLREAAVRSFASTLSPSTLGWGCLDAACGRLHETVALILWRAMPLVGVQTALTMPRSTGLDVLSLLYCCASSTTARLLAGLSLSWLLQQRRFCCELQQQPLHSEVQQQLLTLLHGSGRLHRPASALLRDLLRWQQQQQQRQSGLPAEGELPEAQRTVEASQQQLAREGGRSSEAAAAVSALPLLVILNALRAPKWKQGLVSTAIDALFLRYLLQPQMVAPLADLLGRSSGGSALPAPLDGEKAAKSGSPEYRVALSKRLPKAPAHTEAAASCAVSLGQESDSFGEAAEEEGCADAEAPCRGSGEEVQRLSKICELQRPQKVVEESFLGSHKGGLTADVSLSTCADEELYGAESFSLFEIPEGGETGGPPPPGPRKEDGVEGPLLGALAQQLQHSSSITVQRLAALCLLWSPSWWTRVGALAASSRLHQHAEGSLRSASHCDGTAAEGEAAEGEAWLAHALSFSGEAQDADAPRTAPSEAAKEGGGRQPASRLRNSLQPRLSAPAALKLLQQQLSTHTRGRHPPQPQRTAMEGEFSGRLQSASWSLNQAAEPDCLAYAVGSNQEGGADPEAEDGLSGSLEGCKLRLLDASQACASLGAVRHRMQRQLILQCSFIELNRTQWETMKLQTLSTEQLIAPEVLPLFVSAASLEEEERKASDALAAAEAAAAQSAKALQQQQQQQLETQQMLQGSLIEQLNLQRKVQCHRTQFADIQQVMAAAPERRRQLLEQLKHRQQLLHHLRCLLERENARVAEAHELLQRAAADERLARDCRLSLAAVQAVESALQQKDLSGCSWTSGASLHAAITGLLEAPLTEELHGQISALLASASGGKHEDMREQVAALKALLSDICWKDALTTREEAARQAELNAQRQQHQIQRAEKAIESQTSPSVLHQKAELMSEELKQAEEALLKLPSESSG